MIEGDAKDSVYDRRHAVRDMVDHRARAVLPNGTELALRIINISPGGLMARCDRDIAPGECIGIDLPVAGTVSARIKWSLDGRIGCRFDTEFAPLDFEAVLTVMRIR